MKTPTAAAEYLIAQLVDAAEMLNELVDTLMVSVNERMHREENRLAQLATRLPSLFALVNTRQQHRIEQLEQRVRTALQQTLVKQTHRLQLMEKIIEGASPQLMLQRGYTITRCNGKVVTGAVKLAKGSILTTEFVDGEAQSIVQ